MPSIVLSATTAAHDGYQNITTGAVDFAATQMPIGRYAGVNNSTFMKFPLPATGWLVGKVVNSLMLTLGSVDTQSGGTNTRCYLEKVASPANLTGTVSEISAKTKTTAFVGFSSTSWDSWVAGQTYSYYGNAKSPATPSTYFTSLLNELVASVSVASIDALAFIIETTSGSFYRLPYAYGGSIPPTLTITYTELPTIEVDCHVRALFSHEIDL